MNTNRIRFGTHARAFRANGFALDHSGQRQQSPAVSDWARYGAEPPSDELIERWRLEYPDCGIGLVMDGRVVAVDVDICEARFRSAGFTVKDAAREAPALFKEYSSAGVRDAWSNRLCSRRTAAKGHAVLPRRRCCSDHGRRTCRDSSAPPVPNRLCSAASTPKQSMNIGGSVAAVPSRIPSTIFRRSPHNR